MNLTKFTELYNMVPEGQAFGADVMAKYASRRFDESVATNPDFYYGPFTGWIARNAGYFFTLRLFANYSSEQPEGYLSELVLPPGYLQCQLIDPRSQPFEVVLRGVGEPFQLYLQQRMGENPR